MNRTIAGIFWIALYLGVVLSPLLLMTLRPTPPGRAMWVEISIGLGFVGLVQIAVQFALIARYRHLTAPYGIDLILKYHRQIALIAIVFLIAHPVILVLHNPALLSVLNPIGGTWASRTGNWALYALVLLALLSLFRKQIRLGYEVWRIRHALLGIAAIVLAHVHVYLAGSYTDAWWKEAVLITISVVMVSFFAYLRLVKPALQRRAAYKVAEVRSERGKTWTLALTPQGHQGLAFKPGQFAWIKLGDSPYTIEEHPFSFSSSAQDKERLEFGIKELGDFTSKIGEVPIGTTAYLDGPHGAFSPDLEPAAGYVLLAGGVGIAPFMSMLRTLADRHDKRPILLFYGDKSWHEMAFHEDLERLKDRLDLRVIYALENPPENWQGEEGFIDLDMLKRHLPQEAIERLYFVCGPNAMMDAVEKALHQCGVPMHSIHSERFDLV